MLGEKGAQELSTQATASTRVHVPAIESSHSLFPCDPDEGMSHAPVAGVLTQHISLLPLHLQPRLSRVDGERAWRAGDGI